MSIKVCSKFTEAGFHYILEDIQLEPSKGFMDRFLVNGREYHGLTCVSQPSGSTLVLQLQPNLRCQSCTSTMKDSRQGLLTF